MPVRDVQEFESLVRRVERVAASSPLGYRVRLLLLTGLGFAVPLIALAVGVGLAALVVVAAMTMKSIAVVHLIKIAVVPIGMAVVILRALMVRIPAPDGLPVTASQAPALFEAIGRVRRVGDSRSVHEVKLIDSINAAVTERPAWGLIGPSRRTLLLGVPLMAGCTPAELDAVLAHEFGHLARNHTRLGNRIYRLRRSWSTILERLDEDDHLGTRMLRAFYRRFSPYYSAYSFVLAQANEYEADANAARATSARTAGDALVRVSIQADRSGRYWHRVHSADESTPEPPAEAVPGLYEMLAEPGEAELVTALMQDALARRTGLGDTHPALKDRLASLGVEPRVPGPIETSAAEAYLGSLFLAFVEQETHEWLSSIRAQWTERHERGAALRPRMEALREQDAGGTLDSDEAFELAELLEQFEGPRAALPYYRRVADEDAANVGAAFHCGRIQLALGEDDGLRRLDEIVAGSGEAGTHAASLLYRHFLERHDTASAARYERVLDAYRADNAQLEAERGSVTKRDPLEPHGLDVDAVDRWREAIAAIPLVKACRVARKPVASRPEEYVHVLCVEFRMHYDAGGAKQRAALQAILDALSAEGMPRTCWLIACPASRENMWLWRKMRRVPGSRLLPGPR